MISRRTLLIASVILLVLALSVTHAGALSFIYSTDYDGADGIKDTVEGELDGWEQVWDPETVKLWEGEPETSQKIGSVTLTVFHNALLGQWVYRCGVEPDEDAHEISHFTLTPGWTTSNDILAVGYDYAEAVLAGAPVAPDSPYIDYLGSGPPQPHWDLSNTWNEWIGSAIFTDYIGETDFYNLGEEDGSQWVYSNILPMSILWDSGVITWADAEYGLELLPDSGPWWNSPGDYAGQQITFYLLATAGPGEQGVEVSMRNNVDAMPGTIYPPDGIPEPGTLLLIGSGLVGLGLFFRRRRLFI